MCQVLDDFLGVLCLTCSRLTPANRVKEASLRRSYILTLHPRQQHCLPLSPIREPTRRKCDALEPSLSLFPMAHQGQTTVDSYPLPTLTTWQPLDQNVLDIREAAVDLGAKGTYMYSLETSLGDNFCSMNSLPPY